MDQKKTESLLDSVSTLLRLFILDETRFPSAEGRMRYNPIDFNSLRFIADHPGCQGADMARALHLAPTTQQSALDRLIRKGFVDRSNHPTNRRAKMYHLTKIGHDITASIQRQDLSNMNTILSILTPEEQDQIVRILDKVAKTLNKTDTNPSQ